MALEESKSETQQHFETLKQQFQWVSWEDADFTTCGVHFRQDSVHGRLGEILLDQHDSALVIESLQCSSSAGEEQALAPWEVSGLRDAKDSSRTLDLAGRRAHSWNLEETQQVAPSGSTVTFPLIFHCHRALCVVT